MRYPLPIVAFTLPVYGPAGAFEPDTAVYFDEPKALWYVTFADGEVITIRCTPNYHNFDSNFDVVEGEE